MKRTRILVAEDHDEMRTRIVTLLCKDFEVVGAVSDGEQLVQAATCLMPDVIVSDIFMPRMDGKAARNKLLDQGCAIPFVFVSSEGREAIQFLSDDSPIALVYKGDLLFHLSSAVIEVLTGGRYLSPHYRP